MNERSAVTRLLREPLLHFVVLGAFLFVIYGLVDDSEENQPDHIVVSAAQVERLAEGWQRTWQRPPAPTELQALIDDHVREEIYYREALAMGLDRDDTIVRRRMRQKLEFLGDDVGDLVEPTEQDLEDFLADHAELFLIAPRFEFRHLYLSPDLRGAELAADAERLLAQLKIAGPDANLNELGDPLPVPRVFDGVEERAVRRSLGEAFASSLARLPTGQWAGPVESGFGLHLVLVTARTQGRLPELAEIREAVVAEWRSAKRHEANEALYSAMRERYTLTVETPVLSAEGGAE